MTSQEKRQQQNNTNLLREQLKNTKEPSLNKAQFIRNINGLLRQLNFCQTAKTFKEEAQIPQPKNESEKVTEKQQKSQTDWDMKETQLQQSQRIIGQKDSLASFLDMFESTSNEAKLQKQKAQTIDGKSESNELKKLLSIFYSPKKQYILPTHLNTIIDFPSPVKLTAISPNCQTICGISDSNCIKVLKNGELRSKNEDKKQKICCVSWVNNSLFVTGTIKGLIKIWKSELECCKTFSPHNHKIQHIFCSDNIIYACARKNLTLSTMHNTVYEEFAIPQYFTFIKPRSLEVIIGITLDMKTLSVFDLKIKQEAIITRVETGKLVCLRTFTNENSFFIIISNKKKSEYQQYSMTGVLIRRIPLYNKLLRIPSDQQFSIKTVSAIGKNAELLMVLLKRSNKVYFMSTATGNYIHVQQLEGQQINFLKAISNIDYLLTKGSCLQIYGKQKKQLKRFEIEREPHSHRLEGIPQGLLMILRSLRERHPQGFDMEIFESMINQDDS